MLTAVASAAVALLTLYGQSAAPPVRERQEWVLDALNLEAAWRITQGDGVTVAVIDSGVDPALPELRGRVDLAGDMTTADAVPGRPGAHGTAMASLIAGSGADGGLIGAAPKARVMSLPIALVDERSRATATPAPDRSVSKVSPVARAIRYAADHGAQVISMPIGAYGPDRGEREAVSYALSRGVVLVAAVGDGGNSAYAKKNRTSYWTFPAGYPGVIGVAAVDRAGRGAPSSSDNLSVVVAAPGAGVPVARRAGGYATADGTSPAAALVAGVAALIKARYPEARPEVVAQALAAGARERSRRGYDDKTGFGVVDAAAALAATGRLAGQRRSLAVPAEAHFGAGADAPGPSRPGPEPLRLWFFGAGAVLGLAAFGWAAGVLSRRG